MNMPSILHRGNGNFSAICSPPTFGLDSWKSYILPVIAMGGYSVSYLARLMRSSLLEVMGQDYIRTARAKGLTEFAVVTKHALRNALIPVITVLGPTVAGLLTGSFVVEKIFAICVIMFAFNFVGDGLRDALDPKLKK